MNNHFIGATATLVGITIGAGIFAIPAVVAEAGILNGIISILFIGLMLMLLNLYVGEVALRTKGNHQLAGYAEKYLGIRGKAIMLLSMGFTSYAALIAYIIGEGQVLGALFSASPALMSVIFFFAMILILMFGLKAVENSEVFMSIFNLFIFALIAGYAFFSDKFSAANFTPSSISSILLPYGVVIFAFSGLTAIPIMREELSKNSKALKSSIILGGVIAIVVYLLFAIAVVGITGTGTTSVASVGLGEALGKHMIILANIFAVLAMATSFLAVALGLKGIYHYDYKMEEGVSWILTLPVPILVFALGAVSFVEILGAAGAVGFGLIAALSIIIFGRAKKLGDRKPEYELPYSPIISGTMILLLVIGAAHYIFFSVH